MKLVLLSSAAILAAWILAGCGSGASSATGATGAHVTHGAGATTASGGAGLQGLILNPPMPAPALSLRNYTGTPVNLSQARGKAALVTFVYTHCPDVCPLIVAGLATAERQLGARANEVQIIAVTVDPRRDTPSAIRQFLAARGALGRIDYLIGSWSQLLGTWKRWKVGVTLGAHRVTVGHSAVVYGVSASGRLAVVYPSNFTPGQIVHDVPLLARS